MKIRTVRQATPAEAAAMLESMDARATAGAELREALERHITPEMVAASLASLPADARRRITSKYLAEPQVRQTVRFTTRKPRP